MDDVRPGAHNRGMEKGKKAKLNAERLLLLSALRGLRGKVRFELDLERSRR
jgi:hypothetical protein